MGLIDDWKDIPTSSSPYDRSLNEGRNHLKNNEMEKAVSCLEEAFRIKPAEPELSFTLAALYQKLKNIEKSSSFFEKTIELRPNQFEYLYAYSMFLHEQARFDEAVKYLHRCEKIKPQNPQLLNDLGVIYSQKQDYGQAVEYLTKVSRLKPDYLVPLINLGHIRLLLGDYKKAGETIDRLISLEPTDFEVIELRKALAAALEHSSGESFSIDSQLIFSEQSYSIEPIRMIEQFGEKTSMVSIALSVVVPVFNEEANIPILYDELLSVLKNFKKEFEIIFIDDGSTDKSREVLSKIGEKDNNVKVIFFRRNYGQTAALGAGFKYAHGDIVVTLDADLQNDPADIPKLLKKMSEGYDLVNGWRKDRRDNLFSRKIPSRIANRIINKLIEGTNVQLKDFGCTLKAYKKGIVKNIHLYGEMHRFIPVFAAWLGVKVTEIPVNHRPRLHGEAKYNLSRISRVIFDLIVVRFFSDYMTRPIQFFGKIAKKLTGWGMILIVILSACGLTHLLPVSLNTILLLTALLLFSSLQILTLGLIGEIMIRFYFEGQHKDYYVVERILNDGEQN